MADPELLPCPFCNGKATVSNDTGSDLRYIDCDNCNACSALGTLEQVVRLWNRRHTGASHG